MLENYIKTINIEAQLMVLMANRYILPAALRTRPRLAQSVAAVKAAGGSTRRGARSCSATYTKTVDEFRRATDVLAAALEHARRLGREAREVHARHGRPGDGALRELGDEHRDDGAADTWPLPTYREMLFVK